MNNDSLAGYGLVFAVFGIIVSFFGVGTQIELNELIGATTTAFGFGMFLTTQMSDGSLA